VVANIYGRNKAVRKIKPGLIKIA